MMLATFSVRPKQAGVLKTSFGVDVASPDADEEMPLQQEPLEGIKGVIVKLIVEHLKTYIPSSSSSSSSSSASSRDRASEQRMRHCVSIVRHFLPFVPSGLAVLLELEQTISKLSGQDGPKCEQIRGLLESTHKKLLLLVPPTYTANGRDAASSALSSVSGPSREGPNQKTRASKKRVKCEGGEEGGGSGGDHKRPREDMGTDMQAENEQLRADNDELRAEIKTLRAENLKLRAERKSSRAGTVGGGGGGGGGRGDEASGGGGTRSALTTTADIDALFAVDANSDCESDAGVF